jgi:hypothetical protein
VRPAVRSTLTVALLLVATIWVGLAWCAQYVFWVPLRYSARACRIGLFAGLAFLPFFGWAFAKAERRHRRYHGRPRRIPTRPWVTWPKWATFQ